VRENRRGNQEWTMYSYWQLWAPKTQDEDKQNKKTQHHTTQKTKMMSNIRWWTHVLVEGK